MRRFWVAWLVIGALAGCAVIEPTISLGTGYVTTSVL